MEENRKHITSIINPITMIIIGAHVAFFSFLFLLLGVTNWDIVVLVSPNPKFLIFDCFISVIIGAVLVVVGVKLLKRKPKKEQENAEYFSMKEYDVKSKKSNHIPQQSRPKNKKYNSNILFSLFLILGGIILMILNDILDGIILIIAGAIFLGILLRKRYKREIDNNYSIILSEGHKTCALSYKVISSSKNISVVFEYEDEYGKKRRATETATGYDLSGIETLPIKVYKKYAIIDFASFHTRGGSDDIYFNE